MKRPASRVRSAIGREARGIKARDPGRAEFPVQTGGRAADTNGMTTRLYLHRPCVFALQPPRLTPCLIGSATGLALAFAFGAAATLALSDASARSWIRLPGDSGSTLRVLALAVGAVGCFASVLVASGFGIKLLAILSHRLGWHPVLESEGPCRLVQNAPGTWGLQMELSDDQEPEAPWPLAAPHRSPASCSLFFPLDEAAAGAVSHLTNPDEALVVRWLDLPLALGGPAVLEIRSPLREIAIEHVSEVERRAA